MTGLADKLTISGWYSSASNRIEEFRLSDGGVIHASQVQSLIDAMSTFYAPHGAGRFEWQAHHHWYRHGHAPVMALA